MSNVNLLLNILTVYKIYFVGSILLKIFIELIKTLAYIEIKSFDAMLIRFELHIIVVIYKLLTAGLKTEHPHQSIFVCNLYYVKSRFLG